MAKLESQLRLSLLDQVTSPIRKISGALAGFQRQTAMVTAPLRGAVGQIAALGAGYLTITEGFSKTFTAAADLQTQMTELGVKSGLSSGALAQVQKQIMALSAPTNQFTTDLVRATDIMVGMGLSANDAVGSIGAVGKAATATGADIADLSSATVSVMQNLKVPADQMGLALDAMANAGNNGAFELKAMARYIPALGAAYQALGQKGVGAVSDLASALQIVRQGTGDESTAANALENLLQKLNAPQTRTAFKKMGVNLGKEMQKASAKGMTPIEAIADVTSKTLKGDLSKIGDLFQDAEVQKALRPLLQNMAEYRRIRDEANRADGTVADAFNRRMGDANEKIKALNIRLINTGTVIGESLLDPATKLLDYFNGVFDTAENRVTVFDRIRESVRGFTAGLGLGSDGGLQKLGDLIFGIAGPNGVAAGEELGKISYRFRQFGEDVRSINDAVQASPVLKFIAELGATAAGMAFSGVFKIFAIAAGAKALIDAVREASSIGQFTENLKNLSALEWGGLAAGLLLIAERAKTVLGIFKKVQEVAPKAGSVSNAAATAGESAVQAGTRGKAMPGPWNPVGPVTKPEGWQAPKAPRVNATGPKISSVNVPSLPTVPAPPSTLGLAGFGVATSLGLGSARKMTPEQSDYFRSRMDGSSSNSSGVRIDADSISALTRKEGTQDVRVTNQQPPNIVLNQVVNQTINGSGDPRAVAAEGARLQGQAAKAGVEASLAGNPAQ